MLKAGIVGLPNVGKSTLFNAITKKNILAANYPFATIDPNIGVVTVPDYRLEYLENLYLPEKVVPTTYEFTDIAGLVKGASKGEGLGNKFLSHIREVDAIVEVVRCFEETDIIHVEGEVNPLRDIEIVNTELIISDLEIIQNRINKISKKIESTKDALEKKEYLILKRCEEALLIGKSLRRLDFDKDELLILKNFSLITLKPIIYMANVSEEDAVIGDNKYTQIIKEYAGKENSSVIVMSAKIESELAELNETDKKQFLLDLGISNSGLDKLIYATYNLLGLETFFTSGKDECRAWTFKKGMKAPECAGIIHSDFERGFIKAEIMSFDDLQKCGSELKVKEAGKMRLEGKEYLMQDGDICYFRFNV
ncbi:MAG: redox-regulated ATPase YchF [Bacilli bacterium]|nr:redox-regulated ATPase YchF [Bacilli bacterium]MDD3895791.1 redox-regulated ATPase YchF [Bacilli bacterium]MDD4407733.1 redox-regulated ATPase YchF [Bacilli bacterium]